MDNNRMHWVDVAKALAVVLVVAYHVSITGMTMLTPGSNRAEEVFAAASAWLLPVRMPLFFMVSGLLAVRALERPWRQVLQPRIADHLWVFALWTLLYAYPYASAYNPNNLEVTTQRALSWTLSLNGAYWYLQLLVAFFVVAKLGRRYWPVLLGLGVLGYIFWAKLPLFGDGIVIDSLMTGRRFLNFFIFFALGAFARPLIERWARVTAWALPLLLAAYVPLALELYAPERSPYQQVLTAALSLIGITFFLGLSRVAARWLPARNLGSYLAARTLPIYVFHPMLLALLIWLTPGFGKQGSAISIWLVPLLVVALTWASCAIYDRTRGLLPWLYRSPSVGGVRRSEVAPVG